MGIQNRQKCLGCITQSAAEHADALDRAIAFVFKAANDIELILGVILLSLYVVTNCSRFPARTRPARARARSASSVRPSSLPLPPPDAAVQERVSLRARFTEHSSNESDDLLVGVLY